MLDVNSVTSVYAFVADSFRVAWRQGVAAQVLSVGYAVDGMKNRPLEHACQRSRALRFNHRPLQPDIPAALH